MISDTNLGDYRYVVVSALIDLQGFSSPLAWFTRKGRSLGDVGMAWPGLQEKEDH